MVGGCGRNISNLHQCRKLKGKEQKTDEQSETCIKINNKPSGEIEVRNDNPLHYKQIKFWLNKVFILDLLKRAYGQNEIVYKSNFS